MKISVTNYHRLAKAIGVLLTLMGAGLTTLFVVFVATGGSPVPGLDGLGLLVLASIGAFALPLGIALFRTDAATSARLQIAACALGLMAVLRLGAFLSPDLRAAVGATPLVEFLVLGAIAAVAFFMRPDNESPIEMRSEVELDVPASEVWSLMAERFGEIGQWAVAIRKSTLDGEVAVGAVRTCEIGGFGPVGAGEITEELTELDRTTMKFTYAARSGLPSMLVGAENRWSIEPLGPDRARVRSHASIDLRWWALPFARLIGWGMRSGVPAFFEELRHRVENGTPHPRKLAQSQ